MYCFEWLLRKGFLWPDSFMVYHYSYVKKFSQKLLQRLFSFEICGMKVLLEWYMYMEVTFGQHGEYRCFFLVEKKLSAVMQRPRHD